MRISHQLLLFCCCIFVGSSYGSPFEDERNQRTFSLFNVVKFKNTGCQSTSDGNLQGVCYTKQECEDLGGTGEGNCAAAFGVCCIITVSGTDAACAGTITQNCSYIESPAFPAARAMAGNCVYMINRCSSEICQIRLDFVAATLAQPLAAAAVAPAAGNIGDCGNIGATDALVLAPGAGNANIVPVLCGTLTGQHVYLEASRTVDLAATVTINNIMGGQINGMRSWRIKVSQIECSSRMKAPQGCLQYFTGSQNTIKSFNHDGSFACITGCQISSQDYRACFRQEAGMCGMQFTQSTLDAGKDAFSLDAAGGNPAMQAMAASLSANCAMNGAAVCGAAAANTCSYVQIPGASLNKATGNSDMFCGELLNPLNAATIVGGAAVTTVRKPFELRAVVVGNTANGATAPNAGLAGFSLDATQTPC